MPMDRSQYPDDWEAIAHMVKEEAYWCCEGCGQSCRLPDESPIDFAERFYGSSYQVPSRDDRLIHPQRYVLTVAHLDHNPENCDRSNLRALCVPCHGRYDLSQMGRKRWLKRERWGQLRIEGVL
jgi:hypothetical protein